MSTIFKKMLPAILSVVMVLTAITGCGGEKNANTDSTSKTSASATESSTAAAEEKNYWDLYGTVSDTSELPDWTGTQLKLKLWYAHGQTFDGNKQIPTNDIVSPEVKRVTGVEWDRDTSFDNGGQSKEAKLNMLAAANDWPDVGLNVDNYDKLVEGDKVYDLTELMPKYMPNTMEVLKRTNPTFLRGLNLSGKLYTIPQVISPTMSSVKKVYPDLDETQYAYIAAPDDPSGQNSFLWVRDDILKKLYPNAKTQAEIDALFAQKGQFSKEDVLDVPINNSDDFFKFIRDIDKYIKDNNITEGGKKVYSTFEVPGTDCWPLLNGVMGTLNGSGYWNNYLTYFDVEKGKVDAMYKQPFFKEYLKLFNGLVREGIVPKESFVDNADVFKTKLDNGQYVVSYAWLRPDATKMESKPYKYRKVYMNVPMNNAKFVVPDSEPPIYANWVIFKSKVKEQDLPQILRFYDYFATDVGMKCLTWGPKTAGLWDVKDGKRYFTNKEVEDNMVYMVHNGADLKYNLGEAKTFPSFYCLVQGGAKADPRYGYDRGGKVVGSVSENMFSLGMFVKPPLTSKPIGKTYNFWDFSDSLPNVKQFASVFASGFDPLVKKCFVAANDEQFEAAYKNMVDYGDKNGLDEAGIAAINDWYSTNFPDDYATLKAGSK